MKTQFRILMAIALAVSLAAFGLQLAPPARAQSAKTRIVDRVLDAGGNPRPGKVTFILTRKASGPDGIIPVGATISATLDQSGTFDISVYPSASLSPKTYYQVWFAGSDNRQELIGIYDIPASTAIITLAAYKVTDTNLAAQYTFASATDVNALTLTAPCRFTRAPRAASRIRPFVTPDPR
jgi:hypothetical protein